MKMEFVDGVLNCDGKWNIRWVEHRGRKVASNGTYAPAGCTDYEYREDKVIITNRKENHITIVKQPTLCKTALIVVHELCHWFVHKFFKRSWKREWHKRIDKYL